jgi:uncharacterized protein
LTAGPNGSLVCFCDKDGESLYLPSDDTDTMTQPESETPTSSREVKAMTHEERPDDMQALVTEIARALVDEPDAVNVEAVKRAENTVLRLRVAPSDVGKVIGKQGRTARSMRTILGAVSMKYHHRYTLDILEEDKHGPPNGQPDA